MYYKILLLFFLGKRYALERTTNDMKNSHFIKIKDTKKMNKKLSVEVTK